MLYAKEPPYSISSTVFVCLVLIFVIVSSSANAQRRKLISGNLNGLKVQKSYNLKFTYDSMIVGANVAEKEYLAKKRRDWEEKELGRGPAFVSQWFDARKELYEPTFIRNFEQYSRVKLNDTSAKYTLIVKTKRTEGGWNIGIATHPGEIEGELWIVESADQSNVIAKIGFYKITGQISYGGDFNMTTRINSAYSMAGKGLGDFLKRNAR